jgi:hypothetical protein
MSIVLKENEWAEKRIEEGVLDKKPSETLRRVARKYIDDGYSRREVRKLTELFLLRCDPRASLPKWSDAIDYAVSRAYKYPAIQIESVHITQSEMGKIDSLPGKQIKRLAFTLLCLSKYWYLVSPDTDHWVGNKDNEVMALANINTSIKRQSMMYHSLREYGMVQFSRRVDNTNVKVCFADDDSEVVLCVSDFRNLGYQYLMYHGEPYIECKNCGITIKVDNPHGAGRKQKYCKNCAFEINMKNIINSVMKQREGKISV